MIFGKTCNTSRKCDIIIQEYLKKVGASVKRLDIKEINQELIEKYAQYVKDKIKKSGKQQDEISKLFGYKAPSGFLNKLDRGTICVWEERVIAEHLGYDVKWIDKNDSIPGSKELQKELDKQIERLCFFLKKRQALEPVHKKILLKNPAKDQALFLSPAEQKALERFFNLQMKIYGHWQNIKMYLAILYQEPTLLEQTEAIYHRVKESTGFDIENDIEKFRLF